MPFGVFSGVPDVTHAKCYINRLRDFSAASPLKLPVPILIRTTLTTVLFYCANCDILQQPNRKYTCSICYLNRFYPSGVQGFFVPLDVQRVLNYPLPGVSGVLWHLGRKNQRLYIYPCFPCQTFQWCKQFVTECLTSDIFSMLLCGVSDCIYCI